MAYKLLTLQFTVKGFLSVMKEKYTIARAQISAAGVIKEVLRMVSGA